MANTPPAQRKPKKKANPLRAGQNIDYKDVATLRKFISERGKIRARRVTGRIGTVRRCQVRRRNRRPDDAANHPIRPHREPPRQAPPPFRRAALSFPSSRAP